MDFSAEIILVGSGIVVGFINTLAGGAVVISLTVFMMLGLPVTMANGTNRLPIMFQSATSAVNFYRQKLLDFKTGLKLAAPLAVGSIVGAETASAISDTVFTVCLAAVLTVTLLLMLFSPRSVLKGTGRPKPVRWYYYVWFLAIGFYGGYIHVGIGYMLLAATMGGLGYDIVRANALKGMMMAVMTVLAFAVFAFNGQVNYYFGLLHAAGNVIGAFFASQYASRLGVRFLKWFLVAVVLTLLADMAGIISLKELIGSI